jgi:hypothetical protein
VNVPDRPIYPRRGAAPSVGSGDQTVNPSSALQRKTIHRFREDFGVTRGHDHRQPRAMAHADRLIGESNNSDAEPEMINDPTLFEKIGMGMKKADPALLRIDEAEDAR